MIPTHSAAENLCSDDIIDIDFLKEIIAQKDSQIHQLSGKLESTQRQVIKLQYQIEQLLKRLYGRKSEKIDPNQLMLDSLVIESLENNSQPAVPVEPVISASISEPRTIKKRHPGRTPIPDHLERVEVILDVPEEKKSCPQTGKPLKVISMEISEKLEYRPGKFIVKVYKRPQYATTGEDGSANGVICAPMPDHPIARCKADIGLLSYIIVNKYADHLPLYRQDSIFEREGVEISRATQSSWLMQIYDAICPLEETLRRAVFEQGVLFTDDTPVEMQGSNHGKMKKARLWTYVRGGAGPPLTVYDFSRDRSKQRPLDFLQGYQGYVHADAYSGYDELFRTSGIIEVACWAHARRKFDEACSSRALESTDILARIARLYHEVETPCKDMVPQERCQYRQEHAAPILDGIFSRLEELKIQTLPSEPLRKAIDYTLKQKQALCRYLQDGRLRPDNNVAENAIRPIAVGRKNWLFVGSERAGRAAALYMSLIKSCKDCDINPWEYFDDLLKRIMSHPVNRLRELLPDKWQPLPKDQYGMIIR